VVFIIEKKKRKRKEKAEYPYLSEDRLSYIYKCIHCGAYIKKGIKECYRCHHTFTERDVDIMIHQYRENDRKNWHHKLYFILFMLLILAMLFGFNQ
jgi:hypothetical protein